MALIALVSACSPSISPQPAPSHDPGVLAAGRVTRAGVIATGGFWARRTKTLFTSTDGGLTWAEWPGPIPLRPDALGRSVVVWDDRTAWVVESATSVAYTEDRGLNWRSSTLPSGCLEWVGLSFSTKEHGYLVCLVEDGPSSRVLTTMDGGATWDVANASVRTGSGWLGTDIVAAEPSSIWAAAISQDSGTQPQLAVSRDGGSNWFDVRLPGLDPAYRGGGQIGPLGPPLVDGTRLTVAVSDAIRASGSTLRVWNSSDSGDTWAEVAIDGRAVAPLAFITADRWIAEAPQKGELALTDNAGRDWKKFATQGLPSGDRYGFAFSDENDGMMLVGTPAGPGDIWVVMFVTQDAGRHWQPANIDPT